MINHVIHVMVDQLEIVWNAGEISILLMGIVRVSIFSILIQTAWCVQIVFIIVLIVMGFIFVFLVFFAIGLIIIIAHHALKAFYKKESAYSNVPQTIFSMVHNALNAMK